VGKMAQEINELKAKIGDYQRENKQNLEDL
jgi:hypothetical protein